MNDANINAEIVAQQQLREKRISYQFNKMDGNFFHSFFYFAIFFPFDQSIIFSFLTSEWIYNFIIQFLISQSVSFCSDWIYYFLSSCSSFFFTDSFHLFFCGSRGCVIFKENQIAALFSPKCIHRQQQLQQDERKKIYSVLRFTEAVG